MFVVTIDFYLSFLLEVPWCLSLLRYKCNLLLSFNLKTYFVCLPDTFNKFAFTPCMSPGMRRSTTATVKEKLSLKRICEKKNLSLIVCSCNRWHSQLKSLGSGSAQMRRPRADLMISHLGGTEGRGASVWNFLSRQCHLQKWPRSKQGWCGFSSSDVSCDGAFEMGSEKGRRLPGAEPWDSWEWRFRIAYGPGWTWAVFGGEACDSSMGTKGKNRSSNRKMQVNRPTGAPTCNSVGNK